MIQRNPFPIRNAGLILFLVCLGLLTAYVIFIAVVSIRIGLNNISQDGFFIPILCGLILCATALLVFIVSIIFVINSIKEKDLINL
jgi:hypothetical protein